jgi:hypothetical protein
MEDSFLRDFANLPIEFVFNFSPSSATILPNLPPSMFSSQNEYHTVFVYSAQMSINKVCVNNSLTSVGEALVVGQIIPHSTTLTYAVKNLGCLDIFFQLFHQIPNGPDPLEFLINLLGLVTFFVSKDNEIEDDFFNKNGSQFLPIYFQA